MPRRTRGSLLAAALLLVPFAAPALAASAPTTAVAEARELIDAQRPAEALAAVNRALAADPDDAEALLVRSTARFMLGEVEAGREDLDRALVLDPELRQGWLNRAGLAVAEERYADALAAFRRAEELDPRAPENDLNLGAVLLLQGELEPASQRFERYLAGAGDSADGWYLVASNYALAGYAALAVEHLRGAVERDERSRRRARSDPNFTGLSDNPRFLRLLAADSHQPPPGSFTADRTFDAAYEGGRGLLLPAVLDVLQLGDRPFDPQVEVAESWALIWGEVRIKVSDTLGGKGRVQLSAPPGSFTPDGWRQTADDLLQRIQHQALVRSLARERQGPKGRGGDRRPPRPPLP
jgi:tetratricopeptide (TPR) repeat protein